jgi:hypothetical protein
VRPSDPLLLFCVTFTIAHGLVAWLRVILELCS